MCRRCKMIQPYDLDPEELKRYRPEQTAEKDFGEFWEGTLKQLAAVPLTYRLNPYDYPVKGVKLFQISFPGYRNANIDGWFATPATTGQYPGIALFTGYDWVYNGNVHEVVNYALYGYATLQIFIRGQYGGSVDNVIPSHGNNSGWMTKGILSREEYYYRAVYMDCVRAVEILASMDCVEATRIGVAGGSQGGGLALAAAALSDIPVLAVAEYPYLSNFGRAIDIAPRGPYGELNDYFKKNASFEIEKQAMITLSYFDIMNHASAIRCHTLVAAGLVDDITPPSTVYAVYNHLSCPKEIELFRYYGHEFLPGFVEKKLRTLMKFLTGS